MPNISDMKKIQNVYKAYTNFYVFLVLYVHVKTKLASSMFLSIYWPIKSSSNCSLIKLCDGEIRCLYQVGGISCCPHRAAAG